jgi:hypothetical protein
MKPLGRWLHDATAAAATLTGKRFGLLVASSLVATSAIVASAMTGTGNSGALAALLGSRPVEPTAAVSPVPSSPSPGGEAPAPSPSPAPVQPSAALVSEAPAPAPSSPPPSRPSEPAVPAPAPPEAGRVKHVFVISLASPGYEAAFGSASAMPYLSGTLRPQGDLLSGYSLLDDSTLPNQIAATGGQAPEQKTKEECPAYDCLYPVETLTLADQMTAGRFEWHGYMEGMADGEGKPANCVYPEPGSTDEPPLGGYAPQANPFVYFHSLLDLGDCALNDVPLTELSGDLSKVESTPSYSLISPDLCNAGVPGQCPEGAPDGAASADAFLAEWVPKILASPAYKKDGLLVVAFDQLDPPDPAVSAPASGEATKVGALLLSRFAPPGATDAAPYDPYSLLRSVEDLFGLEHLGLAAGAKVKSFAPELLGETRGD